MPDRDFDAVRRDIIDAGLDAARRWSQAVLGDAQRGAPVLTGHLRSTGHVEEEPLPGGGARFDIVFGTPYAAYQHEHTELAHPKGGHAKYLEIPFKARAHQLEDAVALSVRRVGG